MAINITIWQPGRRGWNAVLVTLAILLSPLIVVIGLLVLIVSWPLRKIFPPKPLSAGEMVEELDSMLYGRTDYDIDYGLQVITRCPFGDERLELLRQRVLAVGIPPWISTAVDELQMIRERARAIASGDTT